MRRKLLSASVATVMLLILVLATTISSQVLAAGITVDFTKSEANKSDQADLFGAGMPFSAGDWLVLCYAGDNPTTATPYLYDASTSTSYNFTFVARSDNAGSACAEIWYIQAEFDCDGSVDKVFATSTGSGTCCISVHGISGLSDSPLDKSTGGTGTGTDASTGSTGLLSQDDEVCIAVTAVEDEVDDAHGTWTAGVGFVSGNEEFAATNFGGDSSNMQLHSVARVISDGTTQAYQGVDAGHDNTDWAACIATFKASSACSPSISLNTYSWNVSGGSPVDLNTSYTTGLDYFTITNNSGGAVDITITAGNMTGGGYTWVIADDGNAGNMIYGLYAGLDGDAYDILVSASSNTLVAGLADSGTQGFGLNLTTPTVFADPNVKEGTLVLTAACT